MSSNTMDIANEDGFRDLQTVDFIETNICLQGNVEHIPTELLTPDRYCYVGDQGLISAIRSTDFVSSLFLGYFLAMFLIFMLLYLLQRNYIVNLYFALLNLILLLYTGITGTNMILMFFSWFDWYMKLRLEYIALSMLIWLLVAVTSKMLPWFYHKYFYMAFYVLSAVSVLASIFIDITLMNQFIIFLYLCVLILALYSFYKSIKSFRKINLTQGIFLASLLMLVFTNLSYLYYRSELQSLPLHIDLSFSFILAHCISSFCFAVAVLISSTKAAEKINVEKQQLAVENANLVRLNHMKAE